MEVAIHGELIQLPVRSAGGIIISGYNNRITVNNTLEERLRLLEERVRFMPPFASSGGLTPPEPRCCPRSGSRSSARYFVFIAVLS